MTDPLEIEARIRQQKKRLDGLSEAELYVRLGERSLRAVIVNGTAADIFDEAIQVAAVAQRIAECVCCPEARERSGMGE